MQGFHKITGNPVTQILFCTEPQVSVGIIVDNEDVVADDAGRKIVKAGTPMYGSLLDRDTPFKVVTSEVEAKATASVTGTGVTAAAVVATTFSTEVSGVSGTYTFTYDLTNTTWKLDGSSVTISDYGITPTGTPADGDTITVVFVAGYETEPVGVLLHDVDVTEYNDNGTLLIFGFVNINRLDTDTAAALLEVESSLSGKVFVCAG